MAALHVTPVRIRHAMGHRLGVRQDQLPPLSKLQSYSNHFRKTKLTNNDWYGDVVGLIQDHAFTGTVGDDEAFTFGAHNPTDRLPVVGIGSDDEPFVIGVTSKRLHSRMDRPQQRFILHLDVMYKPNQLSYLVLVCEVSDRCRTFHVLALFVMSQQQEPQYYEALSALQHVYENVVAKHLVIGYLMGDGDDTQYNACQCVFGSYVHLMCFYHVVVKFVEHTKDLTDSTKHRVKRDIYDLHFSRSADEFLRRRENSTKPWLGSDETKTYGTNFISQWLSGRLFRWQCIYTAVGFTATNNPAEPFNRRLKRDYTLRSRLKMGTFLLQLLACYSHDSESGCEFSDHVDYTVCLKIRVAELKKSNSLYEVVLSPGSGREELVPAGMKFVETTKVPRIFVPWKERTEEGMAVTAQLGVNYARMKVERQSEWGWHVDFPHRTYACRYFFKFGQCIHLLLAMHNHGDVGVTGNRSLVYRGLSRKGRAKEASRAADGDNLQQGVLPGRPPANGYALSVR